MTRINTILVPDRQRRRTSFFGGVGLAAFGIAVLASGLLRPSPVVAQPSQNDDPVLLRELAERLAGQGFGIKASLLVGSVPARTPALAVPSGWRVIGSAVREIPASQTGSTATLESSTTFLDAPSGTAPEAVDAFTKALVAGGWGVQNNALPGQTGFVSANAVVPLGAQFCAKNVNLSVNVIKETNGPVKVALTTNGIPPGFLGQCGGPGSPTVTAIPQIPRVFLVIPRLVLPEKAIVVNSAGGGGSQFTSSSNLTIELADSPSALESIFGPQMIAAGWSKFGGATTESVSVSTWRKKVSDTPFQATLLIANTLGGDQRRDLTISVSQEPTAGGPLYGAPLPVGLIGPPGVVTSIPSGANAPPTTQVVAPQTQPAAPKAKSKKTTALAKKTSRR